MIIKIYLNKLLIINLKFKIYSKKNKNYYKKLNKSKKNISQFNKKL
jgi:hypothetical protein